MKQKKRIEFVDILKGFAISLIVFGHAIGYSKGLKGLSHYLSSFYVPLFFFIAGYLFLNNPNESILSYFKRKAKKILIPYFIFALLSLIPFYLFGSDIQNSLGSNRMIPDHILQSIGYVFYASGHSKGLAQNSPLWFLPCYFTVVVIGKVIFNLRKNVVSKYQHIFFLFFFLMIGGVVYHYWNYAYPFCFETALVMLYFYFLGMVVRSNMKFFSAKKVYLMGIMGIVIGFSLQLLNGRISCMNNDYQNSYFIFIASASFSVIGYFLLFSKIKKCSILSYLGQCTIPVLVIHKMFLIVFQSQMGMISFYLKNGAVFLQLLIAVLITIIAIGLSILVYKVIVRFLPWMYGESKKS